MNPLSAIITALSIPLLKYCIVSYVAKKEIELMHIMINHFSLKTEPNTLKHK
jgi:hypothetical protein